MNARRTIDWRTLDALLADLPGGPFARGARGPAAFDCWGLVLEVRRRLALALPPDFASGTLPRDEIHALFVDAVRAGWCRVAPALGAIVLGPAPDHHAGVIVAGRVLHAQARGGVVAWSLGHWSAAFGALECWEALPQGAPCHG